MPPKLETGSPIRAGVPSSCIVCGNQLHRKSEHYCSNTCAGEYKEKYGNNSPPFRLKWKQRQVKISRDPFVAIRKKARLETKKLVKDGLIEKSPCVVCVKADVIAHHEDYGRPAEVIWVCNKHHKEYHDGKIGLFKNRLWWNCTGSA